jgi:chromosome segregation protein
MLLTRLRLAGFKSFVDPTEFLIEPGLTGVVGPNGCGKSNLVEALRWVMGESSYKSLRASGMDDVIFSGSGNRPSRNMAEVSLLVDNRSRVAPAAFNDADFLDVSRRIAREEGSTYRINGREVRARDVQLLFADASTGARSPAMVRQGQIGEIIAAKPQARRRILEEAAGIAGLHSRRHDAELRLKAAEDNIQRVEDVLDQIEGQIDALKRQSRQAVRYRTVSAEIRRMEAMLLYRAWREARAGLAEAERLITEALSEVQRRALIQTETATRQAVLASTLPDLREAEVAAAAALQRLILEREAIEGEEKRARERGQELERRATELARDRDREMALRDDAALALDRLTAEDSLLASDADSAAETERAATQRLAERDAALRAAEREMQEVQAALSDLVARRAATERALTDERERERRARADLATIERDIAALGPAGPLETERDTLIGQQQAAEQAALAAEGAVEQARAALLAAREAEQQARRPLEEADRQAQRLETEARTLEKLLATSEGGSFPSILALIEVQRGYEIALGAALGDDLSGSTDPSAPLAWAAPGPRETDPPLPAPARPLLDVVKAPDVLHRRLAQIGLVDKDEGEALRLRLGAGQRLVSREGHVWRWDGLVSQAHAPTSAAKRLAEKNRLGELQAEAIEARSKAEALRAGLLALQSGTREAGHAETAALDAARRARVDLDGTRNRLVALERRLSETSARRASLTDAETRANAAMAEMEARRADLETQLSEAVPTAEIEAQLADKRRAAEAARAAATEARALVTSLQREHEFRARRRQAIAAEQQSWQERVARSESQRAEIALRLAEVERERATLAEAPDLFQERRRRINGAIEMAESERKARADALAEAETALGEADRAAREALAGLAAAREDKARLEARLDSARSKLIEVQRTIPERLDIEPEALHTLLDLGPQDEPPPGEALERRLDELRADRERLGAVNLRADTELTEVEQRRDALTSERDDLTEAIKRLRGAIGNLNREGRERLLAAFSVVQGHFERLFTLLFGGGTAQLELIESDDPLEAGLEIVARPPGKKPQTMTLLSGGEQALTAIALIFAVFLTNPSPICVLDEVDAPLDDANVERYCDLLRDMARSTQTRFLVITHNPITMARMDRLFGVTMAERGVSQLVSVDLGQAERFLEAV